MALVINTILNDDIRKIIPTNEYKVDKVVVISIEKPIYTVFSEQEIKQSEANIYEAVALVIDLSTSILKEKRVYVIAENVIILKSRNGTLISIQGFFKVIPNSYLIEFYKSDASVRNTSYEKFDQFLEINKSKSVAKIFSEISEYFTAENYQLNNNVFKLIKHREMSVDLAKKVLIKSLVGWQLKQ